MIAVSTFITCSTSRYFTYKHLECNIYLQLIRTSEIEVLKMAIALN